MKLQSKLNIYHLITAVIGVIIIGIFFSIIGQNFVLHERREHLEYIKGKFLAQADNGKIDSLSGVIEVKRIKDNIKINEQFKDTTIYEASGIKIPYLILEFSTIKNRKNYKVTIFQGWTNHTALLHRITFILIIFFILLILLLYGIPSGITKKIWHPFYTTLSTLKNYHLAQVEPVNLPPTKIKEFKELNEAIITLTDRVRKDYLNLKEFTENASHEIQTPLAIIKSKIELFLQEEHLSQEQLNLLQDINDSASRLSKLNQSLLLLTKIENRQFEISKNISINKVIEKQLTELNELIEMRHINIERHYSQDKIININPALADILIRNLLKNAIRYCSEPFKIDIALTDSELTIANTGKQLNIPPEKLFERFIRDKTKTEAIGLGLAIVKKICDIYGFRASYSYEKNSHTFKIIFIWLTASSIS